MKTAMKIASLADAVNPRGGPVAIRRRPRRRAAVQFTEGRAGFRGAHTRWVNLGREPLRPSFIADMQAARRAACTVRSWTEGGPGRGELTLFTCQLARLAKSA